MFFYIPFSQIINMQYHDYQIFATFCVFFLEKIATFWCRHTSN